MAFDPSVLSDISGPDPVGAKERAYKLKDLIDTEQMDSLRTYQAKQEQTDLEKAKKILSKGDISTPEGMMSTASNLSKAGLPQQAMGLMKEAGSARQQAMQLDEGKLRLLQMSSDVIGPAALQIKQTLQTQGLAMAQAQYSQQITQILPTIPPEFRGRMPTQLPNDPQQAMQMLDSAINTSQQARQIIAQQLATRKEETAEKSEAEKERHDREMEATATKRVDQAGGGFTDEMGALMAALAERGVSLPTGFRSKAQQAELYKGLLARNQGKSPDEIADGIAKGQIEFGAQKKETQVAAGMAGKIEVATNELEGNIPYALELSAKVPRGKFVPWNKLKQAGMAQISDPDLKSLKAVLTTISNNYDVISARGGTDMAKREHTRQLFDSADSPEALKAVLGVMQREATIAHSAAVKATKAPELPDTAASKENDPLGIR